MRIILSFLFYLLLCSCESNSSSIKENEEVIQKNIFGNKNHKYIFSNDSLGIYLKLIKLNDSLNDFELKIENIENCNFYLSNTMKNIDINMDFDESDPENLGRATQMFEYKCDSISLKFAVPYFHEDLSSVSIYILKVNKNCIDSDLVCLLKRDSLN
jgi:hypothetical protein